MKRAVAKRREKHGVGRLQKKRIKSRSERNCREGARSAEDYRHVRKLETDRRQDMKETTWD